MDLSISEEQIGIKKKIKVEEIKQEAEENDEHFGMDEITLRTHEEATKVKTIG